MPAPLSCPSFFFYLEYEYPNSLKGVYMTKSGSRRNYEIVGSLLSRARRTRRMSQTRLAEKLGRQQGYISRCEVGDQGVNLVELHDYCRVLGISLQDFVKRFERAMRRKK